MNFRKIFHQNISGVKRKMNSIHCKTTTLHFFSKLDGNCSTAMPSSHCGTCNMPSGYPTHSKHCLTFAKKNKQTTILAIINIKNLRETVSQVYSLSKATVLSCLPIRSCQTTVFFKSLHIIPPILEAMFFP